MKTRLVSPLCRGLFVSLAFAPFVHARSVRTGSTNSVFSTESNFNPAIPNTTITVSAGTPDNAVTDTVKSSIPKSEAGGTGSLFGRLFIGKP